MIEKGTIMESEAEPSSKPVVIPNAFYVKKMWVLQETLIIPQGKIIVLSH